MELPKVVQTILYFLFGTPHPGMSTFFLFAFLTLAVGYLTCKKRFRKQLQFVMAYTVFVIVAHHMDLIIIDNIAPAKDSTRTFVIILLSARLLRELFDYIQLSGVTIPAILSSRVQKMEAYPLDFDDNQWHPDKIDEHIALMKERLKKMEQYERLANRIENSKDVR